VERLTGLGDADPEAHRQARPVAEVAGGSRATQQLRQLGALAHVAAGYEDEELLAADPVGEVVRPQLLAEHVGEIGQDRVAGGVSEGVVDPLEVVNVTEDHPDWLAGDLRLLRQLRHPVLECLAVEHPRELVDHGLAAMLDV